MNRRELLAAGTLAGLPAVPSQTLSVPRASAAADPALFKNVDLQADGLALAPREYAALLSDLVMAQGIEADYYSAGGTVEELEREFAQLLGKPAAIFLPTGTLANHLAVRRLAGNNRRVIVQAESHLYNDSGDCAQTLSGLNLIPLAPGRSTFDLDEVRSWVERSAAGRVETRVGVISIESPVRRKDHKMFDAQMMQKISDYARDNRIRLHLDGARMFTLPQHSHKSLRDYAALFDSVYVSLWKHFNGASGAILAGDAELLQGMFHTRRMFGGSLQQAWPEIALVSKSALRFQEDYARAWKVADELIELLDSDARFKVRRTPNRTSRFLLSVSGTAPEPFVARLMARGVMLSHPHPDTGLYPVQVNPTLLRTTSVALFRTIVSSLQ
jgi:threonine aldolase